MNNNLRYVLAMAWRFDQKWVDHFEKLYPLIMENYMGVSIVAPPNRDEQLVDRLENLPHIKLMVGTHLNENRRYQTIQQALEFDTATHIHYCDGDHVLSRMERYLDDWKQLLKMMATVDCVIVGRSSAVFESYPRALRETERIINQVCSHLIGFDVDLGSGSRGFSRRAVEYLVKYASPETHSIATDSEWVILLHRAGFQVRSYASDGAIYEVRDEDHRQRLESVDQWSKRVNLAQLIIQAGIDASKRMIPYIDDLSD